MTGMKRDNSVSNCYIPAQNKKIASLNTDGESEQKFLSLVRKTTFIVTVFWLALVAGLGWWMSRSIIEEEIDKLAASVEYEAETTARIVDRLFTELSSVAKMVAGQNQVIQLANRYRVDPPGFDKLTRQERAEKFTSDPAVRKVGDYMTELSNDLRYARIYMNNLSHDTVIASQWSDSFNIVGQIYTGRAYLNDALRLGKGQLFGIARLNQMPSYFVSSRIDGEDEQPLGSVTVRLDAPDIVHYLTGQHIALIVNRQGRVATASSESFSLRNVAALLPPDTLQPSDGDEGAGEPMDVHPIAGQIDQWLIEGRPYLLRNQPLTDTQYQLLTLAALDHMEPIRRQHVWTAGFVAAFGIVLTLLGSHMVIRFSERRRRVEQDRILAISQAAERDLTIKVHERTAELAEINASLKAEMDRREVLKMKLRQSFNAVNAALSQQRDFVALVSHEFRGPLSVIAAAADNLSLSTTMNAESIKLRATRIRQTVNRMSMLIENVLADDKLNAERKPAEAIETVDLTDTFHAARLGLDDNVAKRVYLLPSDKVRVKGDRNLLEIIVQNLIQNALKYSTPEGHVSVFVWTDGKNAYLDVKDEGSGVAAEDRELIFKKYYRAAGQKSIGSGLGLYISKEIARQHGGDLIVADSGPNGSTFRLTLPIGN